jgi:hypothetical protein
MTNIPLEAKKAFEINKSTAIKLYSMGQKRLGSDDLVVVIILNEGRRQGLVYLRSAFLEHSEEPSVNNLLGVSAREKLALGPGPGFWFLLEVGNQVISFPVVDYGSEFTAPPVQGIN